MTTEFIEGLKATNLEYLEENSIDRETLTKRIITAYCQMIFTNGVCHADPHPGNLLIQTDGSVYIQNTCRDEPPAIQNQPGRIGNPG